MTNRWKIFAVLAMMYVMAYFYRVSMAVVVRDMSMDLGLSAAMIGTLSGIFFYVYALVQIPLGPLIDRLGGRMVISVCGVLTVAGTLLFAFAPGYGTAMAGRIFLGVGTACVLMASLKIFGNWFSPHEFATISGFMVAVGNLGNLSATAPLAFAVSRLGWRQPFVIMAAVQAVVTVLVFTMVRDHPPAAALPEKEPLYEAKPAAVGMIEGWKIVFASPSFWLLSLLSFFWYGNYMVLQGLWGGPYLMDAFHLSREAAGKLLMFTSLGFICGCLVVGKISDHLLRSRKWTLFFGQSCLLALMTLTLGPMERIPHSLLGPVFFAIGLAVSSGVTIYPMIKEMFPPAISATAMTALNFFVVGGAAVVQQSMGLYIERFPRAGSGYPLEAYHGAFLIPVSGLVLAVLLFLFVKDTTPAKR